MKIKKGLSSSNKNKQENKIVWKKSLSSANNLK